MPFRIAEVESSIPFESTKRKCDLFRQVAFSFGFRSRWSLHPSVIEMLGRSEFALRQGFRLRKNACTAQRRCRPEGRLDASQEKLQI